MATGTLYGVGVGPGDPELMTLKAARLIGSCPIVAYFAKRGRQGHARRIVDGHIGPDSRELRLEYPFTTEVPVDDPHYPRELSAFYSRSAEEVAAELDAGRDVAVICEGDPFFYGSFMYLFDRLSKVYPTEIVPGISGMHGCWAQAKTPICHGDDVFSVLPGTMDGALLTERLKGSDAAVIMKIGRNLEKVRTALAEAGLLDRAIYVEQGTMAGERVEKLADLAHAPAPYFSLILVPGRQGLR
ncbi:precorrin-2 C(20)-methyltransferase [Rhodobium gokarnense]|uniref:Precorrin-2/cobalt-factor-2 C20-methyltransferase n=1 Tax=Rhodobium gokarnense TaxID=364296 RepID=A0ABT3H6L4_9HYPH|nr:precorrin-2 C(20)-methyltransferase [Rhodobium gokarnense]MCW2306032.1 precorrin-2/cobalt-factor-2 C20-methyltransferase [Rhodobium gokarnense]